jgi:transposase-like protein
MYRGYGAFMAQRSLRQYAREYKLDAVERAERTGSVRVTARTLRINETLLQRWVREARQKDRGQAFPGKGRRAIASAVRSLEAC